MDTHVLRGETEDAHIFTWDKLKAGVQLEARGLVLHIRDAGSSDAG